MNSKAVRKDTISERLSTLAGAIGALESAIAATDQALLATSSQELSAAISAQSQAAKRTIALKQSLQHSLPPAAKGSSRMSTLHDQLQAHPDAETLLPQFEQIEERLAAGQISLTQQAQVVNKMQSINRQLLGVLTDVDNHGYNQRGNHNDTDDGRLIARA